jgi:hypothetical protein
VTVVGTLALSVGLALGVSAPAHATDGVNVYGGSAVCRPTGVSGSATSGITLQPNDTSAYLNYVVARSDGPLELNGASYVEVITASGGIEFPSFRSAGTTSDGQYLYRTDPDVTALNGLAIATSHPNVGHVC